MTKEELFNKYATLCSFEEGEPEYLIDKEDFEKALKEYARIKCLKAIENTRSKAYDILEEWCDAGNPNVKEALNRIDDISDQDVIPEL